MDVQGGDVSKRVSLLLLLGAFLEGKNITQKQYYQKLLFLVICSFTQVLK